MRRMWMVAIAVAVVACGDEAPLSGPGVISAELVGPNASEGAAVVVLVGEGIQGVTALGDSEVYASVGTEGTQVVLINQLGGTLAFSIAVADTTQPIEAVVQQVAGPDDALRADVTQYTVEFGR